MPPAASLIVTSYNRKSSLDRLCATLAQIGRGAPEFELVITLDGATDGSLELLHRWSETLPLRVLAQARRGPAAGRNSAIAAATGEILIFLDDDVIPLPGMIDRHIAAHRDDPSVVGIGPMLPPPGRKLPPWLRWEAVTLQKQYDAMVRGEYEPTPRQFYTANASVRREHALAIGGFDETFTRAEDIEFAYRLADRGIRFEFLSQAAVIHDPARTWQAWQDVAHQYGRHSVIFERDRGRKQLSAAYAEWGSRHPLNRWLAQACVGHPLRSRLLRSVAGLVATHDGSARWEFVQLGLCSAVYSTLYWQGIADETGLGRQVWAYRPTLGRAAG